MSNGKLKRKFKKAWYQKNYELVAEMCMKYDWLNFYIPKSDHPNFKSLLSE